MTIVGLRLKRDLSGENILDLEESQIKKNIAVTRVFETMYSDYDELRERVSTYAAKAASKLRKQDSCLNLIQLLLLTNPFRKDLKQYRASITLSCPYSTNSSIDLIKLAQVGPQRIY